MNGPDLTREQGLLITGSLVLMGAVALSFALSWASSVAIPLVLALLVVYLVGPLVDTLQVRMRAPRWLAILAAFVVIAAGIALLTALVSSSVSEMATNGETYAASLRQITRDVASTVNNFADTTGITVLRVDNLQAQQLVSQVNLEAVLGAFGVGTNLLSALTSFLANAVLVILFAVIIIAGRRPLETRAGFWGEIDVNVQRYLAVKFLASTATGVLTWLLLWVLDIPLALVFGLAAFFLNFIPSVGSIIAMLLPLPVAYLAHVDQPFVVVLALVLPGGVQFLIGNVLEPRFQGDRLGLHTITVLLTLIFWTLLWGVPGAVISVPITAVLRMVLDRFETTRPMAEILAGRLPALPQPDASEG